MNMAPFFALWYLFTVCKAVGMNEWMDGWMDGWMVGCYLLRGRKFRVSFFSHCSRRRNNASYSLYRERESQGNALTRKEEGKKVICLPFYFSSLPHHEAFTIFSKQHSFHFSAECTKHRRHPAAARTKKWEQRGKINIFLKCIFLCIIIAAVT